MDIAMRSHSCRILLGPDPVEGGIVLSDDEARAWETYRSLGKPEEIGAVVEEHGTLKAQLARADREDLYGEIGEALKWNAAAIADIPGIDAMDLVVKDGSRAGKPARVAHVRETTREGDKDVIKETPLDQYIQKTRPHLMPALVAGNAPAPTPRPVGGPPRHAQRPNIPDVKPGTTTAPQRKPLARW